MPKRKPAAHVGETKTRQRTYIQGGIARRVELYRSAYKLAQEQLPRTRIRPDTFLRIHASIRRQIRAGETDARVIASEAVKDALGT
jgi:hypothetical protein